MYKSIWMDFNGYNAFWKCLVYAFIPKQVGKTIFAWKSNLSALDEGVFVCVCVNLHMHRALPLESWTTEIFAHPKREYVR